jgi:hypothetical protein
MAQAQCLVLSNLLAGCMRAVFKSQTHTNTHLQDACCHG